jgi:putative ABC transport system permease protein
MPTFLFILPALIRLTVQRLASRPVLTLLSLVGIVLAVGLLTSAAFFSQAVDRVILTQELDKLAAQTGRSPFATRVYFLPSARFPVAVADAERLGLPIAHQGLTVESGGLLLLPPPDDTRYGGSSHLMTVNAVYVADVADHLMIEAGEPLANATAAPELLDVWLHADLAAELGVQVGERFHLAVNRRLPAHLIHIRGLWRAKDPTAPFWFSNPDSALRTGLLVTRESYVAFIEPMLPAKAGFVTWHIRLDETQINPAAARQYAEGFERGMAIINQYLAGAKLDVSPLDPLKQFVRRQSTLMLVLLGFHLPGLAFLLYFLLLVALISMRWQLRETALLVSRGMGAGMVLGLTLLESALLFVVGTPLGIALGIGLARWMGFAVSFLQFTNRPPLPVTLQGIHLPLLGAALAVALAARLVPLVGAARHSVVSQAQESARPVRPPAWQRFYLDVLLILPTYYALDQLSKRGTLALRAGDSVDALFQDPLLVLVPALFVLTTALISMRLFPWLMHGLDWVASHTRWLALHLALRQLGRSSQHYINPLLLVVVALALGIYSRSLAGSLDQWLSDRIYYEIGADLTFQPLPLLPPGQETTLPPDALFIPPKGDLLDLPGVQAVTRVGDYSARLILPQGEQRARLLAIDREDFAQVAWFRRDFAAQTLGALMNDLALSPDHVLVNPSFLAETGLRVNDQVTLQVSLGEGYSYRGLFRIAGIYDYFPTVQPAELTLIGNLEHLFTELGAQFEHQIWVATTPTFTEATFFPALEAQGISAGRVRQAGAVLAVEQGKMERVGIFGTLSVGFVAATGMAILALLVHSYASMQERLYLFGVLRALGLRQRQVLGQVALEYGLLTAYGAAIGTGVGLWTAALFAPFLRIPAAAGAPPPPLIPFIDQGTTFQLAMLFAGLMVLAEVAVLAMALSRRLFDVLRVGHQG